MKKTVKNLITWSPCHLITSPKSAFTLAEVLITLAIIGVVAAMTIPTLISNYKEKATITKVLKAYSNINNVYQMAKAEHGNINQWGFPGNSSTGSYDEEGNYISNPNTAANAPLFWSKMTPYMKVISQCNRGDQNCKYPKVTRLNETYIDLNTLSIIELADGTTMFGGWMNNINCNGSTQVCGDFAIDINGSKTSPNTIGKDIFYFNVTQNAIIPMGKDGIKGSSRRFPADCNLTSTSDYNGYACTVWIIENKNMDYLHCNDLSWNGKRKCSD